MWLRIIFELMLVVNVWFAPVSLSMSDNEEEETDKHKTSEERPSKLVGTTNFSFEAAAESEHELIPHHRAGDKVEGIDFSDMEDYSLDPTVQGNPLSFLVIFGDEACDELNFCLDETSDKKYIFTRMPTSCRVYEVLSKTKSFNNRFLLSNGLVKGREFLAALAKGAVFLTDGKSPFKGSMKEIASLGLERKQLAYQYMIHDLWNHCVQATLPEEYLKWLSVNAENLSDFASYVEKHTDSHDKIHTLLPVWIGAVVSFLDQRHGSLTNVLAGWLLFEDKKSFRESMIKVAHTLDGLMFGHSEKFKKVLLSMKLLDYTPSDFKENSKDVTIGNLTMSQSFMNLVLVGIAIAREDCQLGNETFHKFAQLATEFAKRLNSETRWSPQISAKLLSSLENEQMRLGKEISQVLSDKN